MLFYYKCQKSNYELIDFAKKLKMKYFRGYYMNDEIPKKIKTNECGIVNLQDSDEQGSHHVVISRRVN